MTEKTAKDETKKAVQAVVGGAKNYHLSDILSITTGRLVSTRHILGVYDILNFMTDDNLFTHQLPRAGRECAPFILEQHPQLKEVNAGECDEGNWEKWLKGQIKKYGVELPILPLPKSAHERINPIEEAVTMMGGATA